MLLACLGGILFSLSAIAVSSQKMSGADATRGYSYDGGESMDEVPPTRELGDEEDLEEDAVKVVRRAVRKYPEESESARQQEQMPITRLSCDCPEVLTKGTLAAIVAALAFLGFFSTSVLLVVSIWVLRLMSKQKKTDSRDFKRHHPPTPPPRPDRLYGHKRRSNPYETIHATQTPPEGVYISASEINPGPRRHYSSRMSPGDKSSPENEYVAPEPLRIPSEEIYASIQGPNGINLSPATGSPAFLTGSPAYNVGSPAFNAGSPAFNAGSPGYQSGSQIFHGGSPAMPSGSPVGSPGSPVGSPKGRMRGTDEHIYEEVN